MFIELTVDGLKVSVNLNQIVSFNKYNEKTRFLIEGSEVVFDESYEQVKELIKQEVAAERGYWNEPKRSIQKTRITR